MRIVEFDDYVGFESCADLKPDFDAPSHAPRLPRRQSVTGDKADFPPPIPGLARTENQASHMPWVMRKYYTGDGRLVIMEEKVPRHEYFKAHRSNGRLLLDLIPLDDVVPEICHVDDSMIINDEGFVDGCDERIGDPMVEEFYKFNGVGMVPCGGYTADAAAMAASLRPPVRI